MQNASIFVLSSRFEGFGMVLAEAMSQGCACISFDCPTGPSEIIDHEVNGILVKDQNTPAMVDELQRLMADEGLRKRLAVAGIKKAEKFAPPGISERWVALFKSLGLTS
jgi:glycosyltransferase involved in cell wall biosynthesis